MPEKKGIEGEGGSGDAARAQGKCGVAGKHGENKIDYTFHNILGRKN